jgi:hypothetical protein
MKKILFYLIVLFIFNSVYCEDSETKDFVVISVGESQRIEPNHYADQEKLPLFSESEKHIGCLSIFIKRISEKTGYILNDSKEGWQENSKLDKSIICLTPLIITIYGAFGVFVGFKVGNVI